MKNINIVLTGDKNYTKILGIAMTSILENISDDCRARFFLFHQGWLQYDIKEIDKLKLKYNCEINYIAMENYLKLFDFVNDSNFRNKWITISCLFRLLMFNILPDDVDICFYIDGDMIVNCDLSKITLPENKMFGAVIEPIAMQRREKLLSHCFELEEFYRFKKNPLEFPYFNAGFYIVDIKLAKQMGIFEQCINILKNRPNLPYADQDVLNIIFSQNNIEKVYFLPPEYNVFATINYNDTIFDRLPYPAEKLDYAYNNPQIIHYVAGNKPWINQNVKNYYNIWWKYYKISPWGKDAFSKKLKTGWNSNPKFGKMPILYLIFNEIFSLKNIYVNDKKHKVVTILGIKIKIRVKNLKAETK